MGRQGGEDMSDSPKLVINEDGELAYLVVIKPIIVPEIIKINIGFNNPNK